MLGTARIVRADPGLENVKVEVLQKFSGQTDMTALQGKKFCVWKVHNKSGFA